jgi:hypothetical protein
LPAARQTALVFRLTKRAGLQPRFPSVPVGTRVSLLVVGKADHLEARMAALQAESASQQVVAAALQPEAVAESASQQAAALSVQD